MSTHSEPRSDLARPYSPARPRTPARRASVRLSTVLGFLAWLAVGHPPDLQAQQLTEVNWARTGAASQSSTIIDNANPDAGNASLAIDGNTNGVYNAASGSVTHSGGATADADAGGAYWEVDLGSPRSIGRLHAWFRTDCCLNRNDDFSLVILNASRQEVWRRTYLGRPPTDFAWNIAPAVTGSIVRFEPQNPLSTSDGIFSLAELQVIAPYQNVTIQVTKQPADVSINE